MSQLFDSWFGYILWAFAYFEIYRHGENRSRWAKLEYGFNIRESASALGWLLSVGALPLVYESLIDCT